MSVDSAPAVRKAFSAELSRWQWVFIHPPLCAHPNDQSPPERKRMKVLSMASHTVFCHSGQYTLKLLSVHSNLVHNHPQTRWTGRFSTATYQRFLLFPLIASLKIWWARHSGWSPLADVTNSTTTVVKHNRKNGRNLCLSLCTTR